jgi:hypothetical protein
MAYLLYLRLLDSTGTNILTLISSEHTELESSLSGSLHLPSSVGQENWNFIFLQANQIQIAVCFQELKKSTFLAYLWWQMLILYLPWPSLRDPSNSVWASENILTHFEGRSKGGSHSVIQLFVSKCQSSFDPLVVLPKYYKPPKRVKRFGPCFPWNYTMSNPQVVDSTQLGFALAGKIKCVFFCCLCRDVDRFSTPRGKQ